jgi:gliding motility-associated-like protein
VVNATNTFNCTASDSVLIRVLTKPVANAGPDKIISEGERVTLNGNIGGDTTNHFWTPDQFIDNSKITEPVVYPTDDITYTLHVGSGSVCGIATDDVFVHVNKMLLIPNAYSPNGDGINDRWNIQGISKFPESEIKVFNRYGQVIYYSKGYNSPWDGRLNGKSLPGGTYYYTVDRKKDFPLISGWVVIIR